MSPCPASYKVVARRQCTPTIVELWLRPPAGPARYLPGQYVLVEDERQTVPPRSYSIANAPRSDGWISLLVTRVERGQTSRWIHDDVKVGDDLDVTGPYGTFVDSGPQDAPALLLSSGSGLAPIRALAESMLAIGSRPSVRLVCAARTARDVIDAPRFSAWALDCPSFRFCCSMTRGFGDDPDGRAPARLSTIPGGLAGHDVFVAGAPGFVRASAAAAEACGADRARIHTEEFFVD